MGDKERALQALEALKEEKIFTLKELTEDFFKKVVYVEVQHSSGLGGPGCIWMILENGEEYLLGIEGYEEWESEKTVPLLKQNWDEKLHGYVYKAEAEGWVCFDDMKLIRGDKYDAIFELYQQRKEKIRYYSMLDAAKAILNPGDKVPRRVYKETLERMVDEEQQFLEIAEQRERVRLTEEDMEWISFSNVLESGIYLFLFRRWENGSIGGCKWTICFQQEELDHMSFAVNAPIEAYNLFKERYYDLTDTEMNDLIESTRESMEKQYAVHKFEGFVRSYKTLERAKEAVIMRNDVIGGGEVNKENIIRIGGKTMVNDAILKL